MKRSSKESYNYIELVTLLSFFKNIASRDNLLLEKIKRSKQFNLNANRCSFTLPSLYIFLQNNYEELADIEYNQLRNLIYRNPINMTVKSLGAEVVIENNMNNVNESQYALVWNNKEIKN